MRIVSLLTAALFALPTFAQKDPPPNVVIFFVDDMGWSDNTLFGTEGFYETPNMQRLAAQGVLFSDAYASAPVCTPTRIGLATGVNPARTHITNWTPGSTYNDQSHLREPDWDRTMNASEVTLGEAMSASGYHTAHIGKWHLGTSGHASADPLKNGFHINIGGSHKGSPPGGFFAGNDGGWSAPGLDTGTYDADDYLTNVLTDHAVDYIAGHANAPFFLEFNPYAVHAPIQAPADLVAHYQDKLDNADPGQYQYHNNPTYAAMIHTMDASLGRVMDALENTTDAEGNALMDNTIIVFSTDHGGLVNVQGGTGPTPPTHSFPLAGGKGSGAEGGLRVPTIVSWVGNSDIQQGVISDSLVVTHDIYSTVSDLTGVAGNAAHNQRMDSISFRSALEGDEGQRNTIYWHYPHISDQAGVGNVRNGRFFSAMRHGDWKLIYHYEDQSWELYDLAADIDESDNLATDNPGMTTALGAMLADWLVEVGAQMPIDSRNGQAVPLPQTTGNGLGDVNLDGFVDAIDLDVLVANWGDETRLFEWSAGELTGDGVIDQLDLDVVLTNWSDGNPPDVNIPEPASAMGMTGMMLMLMRRTAQRR